MRDTETDEAVIGEKITRYLNTVQGPPPPPTKGALEAMTAMRNLSEEMRGINRKIREYNREIEEARSRASPGWFGRIWRR